MTTYQRCHLHGNKRKYTRWVQVYEPEVNETYYKTILGYHPIPDTVIDRVNIIVKYQQELLVFTGRNSRIIGYDDVDITGVDGDGDENESPLKKLNENEFDYQEDQEEVHPDQEDQNIIQQPIKLELETSEEGPIIIVQVLESIAPHTVQNMKPECPKEIPGLRKSSRVNFQTKQDYISRMKGSKYAVIVAQLEDHGAIHPYAHMFFMEMQD